MTQIIESRRQFKSRLDAKQDVWRAIPALMGDGNGTIEVPGQPNYVYIRIGDGDLGQAFNNRCQLRDNLAIYVGYDPVTDPDRRIFQVLTVRMADYAGAGNITVPNVGPHHTTHEFGGGDDVYVDWRRLMGLRVGRPALFFVTVDPGYIFRAGAWMIIPSTIVDLTVTHAALVGSQAMYVLISLSPVGVVTATSGAIKGGLTLLAISDVPIPPVGHIPLAAVRLYVAQTSIGDTPSAPDIIDLRFPTTFTAGGSNVFGAGTANQFAYWSAADTLASSAEVARQTLISLIATKAATALAPATINMAIYGDASITSDIAQAGDLRSIDSHLIISGAGNHTGSLSGIVGLCRMAGTGTLSLLYNIDCLLELTAAGTVTDAAAILIALNAGATGTITTGYGLHVDAAAGSIGTYYGIYIETGAAATARWAIYCEGDKITTKLAAAAGIELDPNAATGNFILSLSPANLTANRRITFPDATGTAVLGTGTAGRVPYWSATNVLASDASFLFDSATGKLSYDENDWTGGNVIYVPLGGDIQTYINAATAGDTLVLASGEYVITSTITIAKQLNIVGQGSAGFYTVPAAPAHGTVISSVTAAVVAFQINSSNVRIADLSINLTGNASTGINTDKDLTGLVLHNIDVIVTCAGLAQGFTVWSSNIVMRNLSFYITSTNTAAYGFWFWNDNTSTINAIADCFNVTGTVVGAGTAAYCFACENINDANTLTLNLESCAVRALTGTPLDVAVASISTTTSNSTVNCYLCTLDGADYDAYQTNANVLNLGGSVLVNNLVSGTVTYRAAMAAGLGVFSGLLTAGSAHIGDAATNYAAFATDGELTLAGTARVEREFIIPISGLGTGAAKPVETILGNYLGYAFSINDLGYFTFEVPSDWDSTSDLEISIHWYINEAYALQNAEVRWAIIWTACKEDATEAVDGATTTTNSADINIPATAKYLTETLIAIPAASLEQHDVIGFQVKRVALVGGTDPTAEPVVVSIEAEYIANRLGLAT